MKPDSQELIIKLYNFMRDNAEFKEVPCHEMIMALEMLKLKLQHDYFNKIDSAHMQSIDDFLKDIK